MNSFTDMMIQRHLGQAETVSPRPVGLYEPVWNTGIEAQQNLTDMGQDVLPLSLHEAERLIQPREAQAPNTLGLKQEPVNPKVDSRRVDPKAKRIMPMPETPEFQPIGESIPSPIKSTNPQNSFSNDLNHYDFQKPKTEQITQQHLFLTEIEQRKDPQVEPTIKSDIGLSIPLPVSSSNTQGSSSIDWNILDIQQPKTEQIAQRHLFQTQNERRIESQVEPVNKSYNAVDFVHPTGTPTYLGSQIQSNQSERFVVPPPVIKQTPSAPVIKINIGRIEVKAVIQTPVQPAKSSPPPKPRLSLEEYLKKQDNQAK